MVYKKWKVGIDSLKLGEGVKEGLPEKTFGQRKEESEGVSHMDI